MQKGSRLALVATVIIFSIFIANLVMGAFFGARFMSDVVEMLALVGTSVCFVTAIVLIEKQEHSKKDKTTE